MKHISIILFTIAMLILLGLQTASGASETAGANAQPVKNEEVTAIGKVVVTRKGDKVESIKIVGDSQSWAVKMNQNARTVAAFEGKKVKAKGTLEKLELKTVLAVSEVSISG